MQVFVANCPKTSRAERSLLIPDHLQYQDALPDLRPHAIVGSIWDYCKSVNSGRLGGDGHFDIVVLHEELSKRNLWDDGDFLTSWYTW